MIPASTALMVKGNFHSDLYSIWFFCFSLYSAFSHAAEKSQTGIKTPVLRRWTAHIFWHNFRRTIRSNIMNYKFSYCILCTIYLPPSVFIIFITSLNEEDLNSLSLCYQLCRDLNKSCFLCHLYRHETELSPRPCFYINTVHIFQCLPSGVWVTWLFLFVDAMHNHSISISKITWTIIAFETFTPRNSS